MNTLGLTKPYAVRNAWIIWGLFFVIISLVVVFLPLQNPRTVTPVYRSASLDWLAGKPIYEPGIGGYLYLPQACILFVPFAKLPFSAAEVLWRALCIGMLAGAVWRLARLASMEGCPNLFPLLTLLVIPTALESARNGQMNIPMAALMTLAAVDLAERRWWPAAVWLVLALSLKPLILVMLILSALLFRPMRWRLAAGILFVFSFPFLTQHPDYVLAQYRLFFLKSQASGNPGGLATFSDLFGILGTLGIHLGFTIQATIRVAAGIAALALCWIGLRRWDHARGTLLFFALTACFTLLFNPRTENNTYVVAGVPMALFASRAFLCDSRPVTGGLLAAGIVSITANYQIAGTNHWLCPAVCLLFFFYLVYFLLAERCPASGQRRLEDLSSIQPGR